jgi:hypothetical protein
MCADPTPPHTIFPPAGRLLPFCCLCGCTGKPPSPSPRAQCGLFGTACDGSTYKEEAQATHPTPQSFHLSAE